MPIPEDLKFGRKHGLANHAASPRIHGTMASIHCAGTVLNTIPQSSCSFLDECPGRFMRNARASRNSLTIFGALYFLGERAW
jgi:hypothetical protein